MLLKFNAGKVYAGTIREAKEIDRIYIKRDKTVQYKKIRWEWDREKRIYHRMQDETYSEVAGYNIGTDTLQNHSYKGESLCP